MQDPFADRPLPTWFDDAKLGVFLHWGPYSVPAWAPASADIQAVLRAHGPRHLFANLPYAEWYANSMRIDGSPTQRHHRETWGDTAYDTFAATFTDAAADADLDALADVCAASGARYVVLTTKHHDGYCLWPSDVAHPSGRTDWHSARDLVGDLTASVRAAGMRMGLYYSGGFDWSVHPTVVRDLGSALVAIPQTAAYAAYVDAHYRELIDRYRPSVLWNDIAAPNPLDLVDLFGTYYDAVPDGVVNDRWAQSSVPDGPVVRGIALAAGRVVDGAWPLIPSRFKKLAFSVPPKHHDFTSPEYAAHDEIVTAKWESTRGVGHSFGANHNEAPADIITTADLVRSLVDIVAKGGNLLIGIGPAPDGTVPEWQQAPLRGLGDWLGVNGTAIFGARPWKTAAGRSAEGADVRFLRTDTALHAVLLAAPTQRDITLWGVDTATVRDVSVGGLRRDETDWSVTPTGVQVRLPERLAPTPALRITLHGAQDATWIGPPAAPADA